ncbi:hypothetical protein Angca_004208, partial [Angiostrongylus cantonensis]
IGAEELLLRTKRIIDPFNRMGCNIEPTLTVIEFCQFQGPRALTTVSLKPSKVLSSVDIDNLSLWLMSSEVTSGTILNIYNQQMGIYAFSYYTVIYDIRARAFQARKIRQRLQEIYDKHTDSFNCVKCNGHMGEDLAAVKEVFVAFVKTSVLSPISNLAPCVFESFIASLHSFLSECSMEEHMRQGVLYSVNTPILVLPKRSSPLAKMNASDSDELLFSGNEETLRMVSQHLDNLLCPVLTGEDMVVCGSEQRKGTVVDFVEKINLLKPKSHPNHEVVLWTKNKDRPKGIIGVCRNRNESAALDLPGVTILDINASLLRTNPYRGVLLANLKQKRRFPSDATLLSFIAAALTNISSLVYMSRYLSPLNLETENISLDDQRILVNLLTELDFIKYQELKSALERMHPKDVLTKVIQL